MKRRTSIVGSSLAHQLRRQRGLLILLDTVFHCQAANKNCKAGFVIVMFIITVLVEVIVFLLVVATSANMVVTIFEQYQ